MLIGKLIPNFIVVVLQVVFLFAAGMFLLPLMGMDALRLGNDSWPSCSSSWPSPCAARRWAS